MELKLKTYKWQKSMVRKVGSLKIMKIGNLFAREKENRQKSLSNEASIINFQIK
jgi:hypothetical protein